MEIKDSMKVLKPTFFLKKEYDEIKRLIEDKLKKLKISENMNRCLMEDIDEILIKYPTVKIYGYGYNVMKINSGMVGYY